MNNKLADYLAMEVESAKEAGTIGFMARALVQATLPYRDLNRNEFTRTNGSYSLTILSPSSIGLPYGNIPRLLMAWFTTEAVKTQDRKLYLGDNLSQFMGELGITPSGGRWGSVTRLQEQTKRLFRSTISCEYHENGQPEVETGFRIADESILWWDSKNPAQTGLWQSSVTLSEQFYKEISSNPVPVDMRALKALKRSPMALDLYCWLTYRVSYLKKETKIPFELLQHQFGADYQDNGQGKRDFKKAIIKHCLSVLEVYSDVNLTYDDTGLILAPSKTHIPKL